MKTISPRHNSPALFILCIIFIAFSEVSCEWKTSTNVAVATPVILTAAAPVNTSTVESGPISPDASTILNRRQIPILCYHQIRDWRPTDSKKARDYIVPVGTFREQMKMLADSGYHTILPDQLYDYLTKGTPLPSKPVMLTFDDTDQEQFTEGLIEMNRYGFKAVFFIMTVAIGRPNYMTRDEIKTLSLQGHVVGSHTWDHHNVKKYSVADWTTQIDKPTQQLEAITGKRVEYFAYPFGLWNTAAIPELKKHGMKAAFQLTGKRDDNDPLYTIRRMIVPGSWSTATLHTWMRKNF